MQQAAEATAAAPTVSLFTPMQQTALHWHSHLGAYGGAPVASSNGRQPSVQPLRRSEAEGLSRRS
jgi:hypothetical protein